jgi:hypothetical protein
VLSLLDLPNQDFSRARTMDFFALAPLRYEIPGDGGLVRPWAAAWDKISRSAGVTRGRRRWGDSLAAFAQDAQARLDDPAIAENDPAKNSVRFRLERSGELAGVISALFARLEALREPMPAAAFIDAFKAIVFDYLRQQAEAFEDVVKEIEQLGTVDAVGGEFSLPGFHEALRANLEAGAIRESKLGEGVLLADYRKAAGLRFREVVLCGAYEGALPVGPGGEAILEDRVWSQLRERHPFVEDSDLALTRGREAAQRAVLSASGGAVAWSCPLYEPGGTREYYPSPPMVAAATRCDPSIRTAAQVRRTGEREWLRRTASPLGVMLRRSALDGAELTLRESILTRRSGANVGTEHPSQRALSMLRGRRSRGFTEWDGNLGVLSASGSLDLRRAVSPTSLEDYSACGFRYMCKRVLYLDVVEEPEDREMMEPTVKGTLVHDVLEAFFRRMKEVGRPIPREAWTAADRETLIGLLDAALEDAARRGQTGREIYAGHEARSLRADLVRFLDEDQAFREETGAVPEEFEVSIPETLVAGVTMRGRADRIDRTPDGSGAWVIDYKTGGLWGYENMQKGDALDGGTKLQLPVYLAAAGDDVSEAQALYWFITRRGGFTRIAFDASPENLERFQNTVEAIVRGVSAGAFPANSGDEDEFRGSWGNCTYCDFDRICSRRRDEDFAAKSADAAMAPWHGVAEAASPEALS